MHIVIAGLNHESAAVHVRERFSFDEESARAARKALLQQSGIYEVVILSTCNRVEVYVVSVCASAGEAAARSLLGGEELYVHRDSDAVEHLFRVAAGIDSMIVGETEILGQVRRAFDWAHADGSAGRVLGALGQDALRTGKRARTETAIGRHACSVSSAALDLARRSSGSFENRTVLVIGTGDVAGHAVESLCKQHLGGLIIASRTLQRGQAMAQEWGCPSARTITEADIESHLGRVDVIIAATRVTAPIVSAAAVERCAKRSSPLVIVDIGVPRNVDPEVRGRKDVQYFDMDDVQKAIATNSEARFREVGSVRAIAAEETSEFMAWLRSQWVQPLVVELRLHADEIRAAELERTMHRLRHLSEQDRNAIERLTQTIIKKLLHEPTVRLKEHASGGSGHVYAEALRKLFNLEQQS